MPALRLEPAEGTAFVTNFKGFSPLTGGIIGMVSPDNTKTSELTLTYEISGEKQSPIKFYLKPGTSELQWLENTMLEEGSLKLVTEKPVTISYV